MEVFTLTKFCQVTNSFAWKLYILYYNIISVEISVTSRSSVNKALVHGMLTEPIFSSYNRLFKLYVALAVVPQVYHSMSVRVLLHQMHL